MKKNLFQSLKLGFLLSIAVSLSMPVHAEQASKHQRKLHHSAKHQAAHSNKKPHKKATNKKSNKLEKVSAKTSAQYYVVQPGDVFGKVAQKYQPPGLSLKKVMALIYADNKKAFINGDPKRLIVGAKLIIPSSLRDGLLGDDKNQLAKTQVQPKPQSQATTTLKANKEKELALLEDDPKNMASQIKVPAPTAAELQPTTPSTAASSAVANAKPLVAANTSPITPSLAASEAPLVAPGEIPPAEKQPLKVRHDTGFNGFILVAATVIIPALIIYLRMRLRRVEKEQQALINQLMGKQDEKDF